MTKIRKNKWKILATASTISSVVLCYLLTKRTLELETNMKDMELVKRVVGGPLIDRLIKNEELRLSRIDSKINMLLTRGFSKGVEKALKIRKEERKNIIETIADFKDVKDALC